MKKNVLKYLFYFSVIFTFTTIVSSVIQLVQGQVTDTNAHILMRGGFVLAATIAFALHENFRFKPRPLAYFSIYAIAQGMVFILVFITGLYSELHPDAYRDAFFNFTSVAIGVMAVLGIIEWRQTKRPENA